MIWNADSASQKENSTFASPTAIATYQPHIAPNYVESSAPAEMHAEQNIDPGVNLGMTAELYPSTMFNEYVGAPPTQFSVDSEALDSNQPHVFHALAGQPGVFEFSFDTLHHDVGRYSEDLHEMIQVDSSFESPCDLGLTPDLYYDQGSWTSESNSSTPISETQYSESFILNNGSNIEEHVYDDIYGSHMISPEDMDNIKLINENPELVEKYCAPKWVHARTNHSLNH